MVKYGMTPLEAIRSATVSRGRVPRAWARRPAAWRPGYAADLIAVAGDPAERIEALADLKLVLVNGRVIGGA